MNPQKWSRRSAWGCLIMNRYFPLYENVFVYAVVSASEDRKKTEIHTKIDNSAFNISFHSFYMISISNTRA